MGENSWIIDNLNAALNTWNEKLAEIWRLLTQGLQTSRGGGVWNVMLNVHSAVAAIGLGLLVLFFAVGVVKRPAAASRKPEGWSTLKLFIRFVLAKTAVQVWPGTHAGGLRYRTVQGIVSRAPWVLRVQVDWHPDICRRRSWTRSTRVGFWSSIPLWAVTLLGGLFFTVFVLRDDRDGIWPAVQAIFLCCAGSRSFGPTFAGEPHKQCGTQFCE